MYMSLVRESPSKEFLENIFLKTSPEFTSAVFVFWDYCREELG